MEQTLGATIKEFRTRRGLTLEQAAASAQVSRRTLIRWEQNQAQPRLLELEAVLATLTVTEAQRSHILTLIDAPRAVVVLRQESAATDWGAAPMRGDLLRAMRLRRGRTLEDVARELKVSASVISRWERSEMWPDAERLHQFCYLLGVREEERAALTRGRLTQGLAASSIEELHFRADAFLHTPIMPQHIPLMDLNFYALSANLWPLAQRQETFRILAGRLCALYANFLFGQNRYQECERFGRQAQDFLHGSRTGVQEKTLAAARVAVVAMESGSHRGKLRAEGILRDILPFTSDPFSRVWVLTLLGQALQLLGLREDIVRLSQDALTILEQFENSWQRREGLDQVIRLLADAGFAAEALKTTERFDAIRQMHPSDALRMAKIMQQLNAPTEASLWLERAYAVLDDPQYSMSDNATYVPLFRRRADTLAAQL